MKIKILISAVLFILLTGCSNQPETLNTPANNINEIITEDNSLEIIPEIYDEDAEEYIDLEEELEEDINNAEDINDTESAIKNGFVFVYNGIDIYMSEYTERILGELGEALDYNEMNSCSFDGIAKTYFYGNFEIETYLKTKNGKDRVYSVDLVDDSVTTAEGVYIGQTYEDMINAYGEDYSVIPEIPGFYSYKKNGTLLNFNIKDGAIISIKYKVEDINA